MCAVSMDRWESKWRLHLLCLLLPESGDRCQAAVQTAAGEGAGRRLLRSLLLLLLLPLLLLLLLLLPLLQFLPLPFHFQALLFN